MNHLGHNVRNNNHINNNNQQQQQQQLYQQQQQQQGYTGQQEQPWPSQAAPAGPPINQVPPFRPPTGNGPLPSTGAYPGPPFPTAGVQQPNYAQAMPTAPGGYPGGRGPTGPGLKQATASPTRPSSFSPAQSVPPPPGGFPQTPPTFPNQNAFGGGLQKSASPQQNNGVSLYNNQRPLPQSMAQPMNGPQPSPGHQTMFNGIQQPPQQQQQQRPLQQQLPQRSAPAMTNGVVSPGQSPLASPQTNQQTNGPPSNAMAYQNANFPASPVRSGPNVPPSMPPGPLSNGPAPVQSGLGNRAQYNAPMMASQATSAGSPLRGQPVANSQLPPMPPAAPAQSLPGPQPVAGSMPPHQAPMHAGPAQARRPMYPSKAQQQQQMQPHLQPAQVPNYPGAQGAFHAGQPNGGQGDYNSSLSKNMAGLSVREGMNKLWGVDPVNLLQEREVLDAELPHGELSSRNCAPDVMRCTLTKIPETATLLQKSRLPLGIVLQPFKDLSNLPVLQIPTIVRCRSCRTYINPFIQFIDRSRWKCNICFRLNDLPSDFLQDPSTGRLSDPELRPEIQHGSVEYIAPSEYMVRPPQQATYLFVMDVSFQAVETGYLKVATDQILECLDHIPGDGRTTVGFVTFDSAVHFYSLDGGKGLPRQMVVTDVDDVFVPMPDELMCNLNECKEQVRELLRTLGKTQSGGGGNCLGAALQAAYKLLAPIGGRVSVFQCCLPNLGPGALQSRENPNERSAKDIVNLNPATDFYKKLALDCSGQQIGVDLFLLSSQFADLATLAGIAKFSSGQVYYYPRFHVTQAPDQVERFSAQLSHYLTRRIGFESVMRIRCTKGLQLHTFHGNFFVRSTDLLSLPNVNPDTGYAMQVSIEESLSDYNAGVFQAAVLYTSAEGERRIRVHTLCLPVSALLQDILHGADQEAVVGLLAKMAVDRSLGCSVNDARDALINAAADLCHAYSLTQRSTAGGLMIMRNCKTLPLYILGLLKQRAFRVGVSTKLDDRCYDMEAIKNLPLDKLLLLIYPALYPLHLQLPEGQDPPRLQLSFEKVDKVGLYLLETVDTFFVWVGGRLAPILLENVFGVSKFSQLPDSMSSLPELPNPDSERIRDFIAKVASGHAVPPPVRVIREDSQMRQLFTQYMVNDRGESVLSYYEFLQHLRNLFDTY